MSENKKPDGRGYVFIAFVCLVLVWIVYGNKNIGIPWLKPAVSEQEEPVIEENEYSNSKYFNNISSDEITHDNSAAKDVDLGNGLSIHICWCKGIKVEEYDSSYDWKEATVDGIKITQDDNTKDLVLTDDKDFIAYMDYETELTYTIMRDGNRALRHKDYSVYLWNTGTIEVKKLMPDGEVATYVLQEDWRPSPQDCDCSPLTLWEVLEYNQKYSSQLAVNGIGLGE